MLLLAISFIGDFFWMVYWVPHWWSAEMGKVQAGLHNFVILCSFANWILKLIIIGTLTCVNKDELNNARARLQNRARGQ